MSGQAYICDVSARPLTPPGVAVKTAVKFIAAFATDRRTSIERLNGRPVAFAQSPGVLKVFGIIPVLGALVFLVASIWQLVAMVVAVRQALDYESTWRAVGVVVIGFVPYIFIIGLVFALIGPG